MTDKQETRESTNSNDFVIREGFPALRLPGGKGPWIDGDEPIPRHLFWASESAFSYDATLLDKLHQDCMIVFSAREKEDNQAYSAGVTYFCPSQMKPRCALEEIVLSIFRMHTKDLEEGVMIPEQSGAEWWTLVLDEDEQREKNEDDDEGDEVGLHFDADYGLEDQAPNLLLHPRLATVTYLTDYGAPTVIFDKRSPPPDDPEKTKLEGPIRRGWLSHPKIGKHVAFDGRLLHGAPATFFPARSRESNEEPSPTKRPKQDKRRITLLVNIWVNHCPLDAEPLDEEICDQCQPPFLPANKKDDGVVPFAWNEVDLAKAPACKTAVLKASTDDPAGEEEFVLCSRIVTAHYNASMEDLHNASVESDLVELDLQEGVFSLKVGGLVEDSEDEAHDDE